MNEQMRLSHYLQLKHCAQEKSYDGLSQWVCSSCGQPWQGQHNLGKIVHVLNRKSTHFPVCVVSRPKERWLCVVKAANEKAFCVRNVPLLNFISQEVPSWNVNPNSRRAKTDRAHKGKDKQMVVEIFIPVSDPSAKANNKGKKKS